MARQSKADKAIDKRIEAAYYASCNGIQIDMMSIPKVFAHGRALLASGAFGPEHEPDFRAKLRAFVDTIAVGGTK